MSEASNAARIEARSRIAWVSCIVAAGVIGWMETRAMQWSNSAPTARLVYGVLGPLLVGVSFIALGYYLRRRWGGWALLALCIAVVAAGTLWLPPWLFSIFRPMGIPEHWTPRYDRGVGLYYSFSTSACPLVLAATSLQLLARRSRPLLEWDMPIGLLFFSLGQFVALLMIAAYLLISTPPVG